MRDPISGSDYDPSITGIKRWAACELQHGVPLLYALVGFAVIVTLIYGLLTIAGWALGWTIPTWGHVVVGILGIFWAFGGWQHGVEAEDELEFEDTTRLN